MRGLDLQHSELNLFPHRRSSIEGLVIEALDFATPSRNSSSLRGKVVFNHFSRLIMHSIKNEKYDEASKILQRWFFELGVDQSEIETIRTNFLCKSEHIDCGGVIMSSEIALMAPIHYAAIFGTEKSLQVVCVKGEINKIVSYDNFTPLHYAVYHQNRRAAEWLLKNGADRERRDDNEKTPYQIALDSKNQEIIDLFLPPLPKLPIVSRL